MSEGGSNGPPSGAHLNKQKMSEGVHPLKQVVILNHLIPFLNVLDYINLRRSLVRFSPLLPSPAQVLLRRFEHRIRNELHLEEAETTALVSLLTQRNDVFLSGGFLVSLLRGDAFRDGQDVDLFIDNESVLKDSFFWDECIHNMDNRWDYDGLQLVGLFNKGVLQFVLNAIGLAKTAISHFDISICRNAFNANFGLRICDMDGLLSSRCIINMTELISNVSRMEYRKSLKDYYVRLSDRAKKYEARGFYIGFNVGTKEEIEPLFHYPPEQAPFIEEREEIYQLMGTHNPDSCIYTKDCRCKGAGDPAARWCMNHLTMSRVHNCDCEHHKLFYVELKKRYMEEHAQKLWEEYEEYWGGKLFSHPPPEGGKTKKLKL